MEDVWIEIRNEVIKSWAADPVTRAEFLKHIPMKKRLQGIPLEVLLNKFSFETLLTIISIEDLLEIITREECIYIAKLARQMAKQLDDQPEQPQTSTPQE